MKTTFTNKFTSIFLGVILLSSILSSTAYAGGVSINLSVNKTSNQNRVAPGDLWDYSVAVRNNSPDPAEFAVMGDPLDANLEFVSVTPATDCAYDALEHEVFCFVPTLLTNEEFVADVTVRVEPATPLDTEIPNTAFVFGDEDEIPEDESTIFLLVSDEDCTCESISIKPRTLNEDKKKAKPVVRILSQASKGQGTPMNILIRMPWTASILCEGTKGGCVGNFIPTANPFEMFTTGIGSSPQSAVIDLGTSFGFGEVNKRGKPTPTPFAIECTGPCPPKQDKSGNKIPETKRVITEYNVDIQNTNNNSPDTRFDVSATITLELMPDPDSPCKKKEGWTMVLKIDSSGGKTKGGSAKQLVVDEDNSDYDNDGMTNIQEDANGDKDFTNDDTDNNDVPDYLEKPSM